ncbi:MAG: rRNA maturation RNase YbeY [Ilumatobacteraceae bacterium]
MAESRPGISKPRRIGGDGEPEIFCADEQSDIEIDLPRWQSLALNVLESEGVRGAAEMTIVFVNQLSITELNEQYMGNPKPTDVLAFPLDAVDAARTPGPGAMSKGPDRVSVDISELPLLLGDVVICPSVAAGQAATHAGNLDDEIALLVVHGMLHVLGADHDTPEATKAMRGRELALLEAHHWKAPAPKNFRQGHQEDDQ